MRKQFTRPPTTAGCIVDPATENWRGKPDDEVATHARLGVEQAQRELKRRELADRAAGK